MLAHPALLAVVVLDVLAAVCLGVAGTHAMHVGERWQPGAASQHQLRLERRAESLSILARVGGALHAAAFVALIVVLCHVLPERVPGAMCGFGVLEAMPGSRAALGLRVLSLLVLSVWSVLDRLNRATPLGALTRGVARMLLAVLPVVVVAAWETFVVLGRLQLGVPASCCAAVLDLAAATQAPKLGGGLDGWAAGAWVTALGAGVIVAASVQMRATWGRRVVRTREAAALAAIALGWAWASTRTLVDLTAPYVYGTLGHRCPLCFFSVQHGAVGYALYGSLAVVVWQAIGNLAAAGTGQRVAETRGPARVLGRRASGAMGIATGVFAMCALGPPLLWYARFGVWLAG